MWAEPCSLGWGLGTRLTLDIHIIGRHSPGDLSRQLLAFLVQTCSEKGQQNPLEIHHQEHPYMAKQNLVCCYCAWLTQKQKKRLRLVESLSESHMAASTKFACYGMSCWVKHKCRNYLVTIKSGLTCDRRVY